MGGAGGSSSAPNEPPLDPPLRWVVQWQTFENRTLVGEVQELAYSGRFLTHAGQWLSFTPPCGVQFSEWQRVSSLGMFAVDEILPCYTRDDASLHSITLLIDNLLESA